MHINIQNALAPAKFSVLAFSRALTKAEQLATHFACFRFFSAAGGSPHSTSYCDHRELRILFLRGNKFSTVYWVE